MNLNLRPYPAMKDSGIEWLEEMPEHWELERGKNLFTRMERPVRDLDEVVTCFRDGTVTLRKNRRTQGFTESLKEIGYQGIRVGDLVIHAMDAFAGAVGVADADGKGTPVYAVCRPKSNADAHYHSLVIREMARSQWILALATGIRERSTDFRFGTYASQRVPLPPLPEQDAIVRYLDHVDRRVRRLVRAKRKLIALLTEQKQAIIHNAVTRGLDPNVPLKDSGVKWLGQVPEHWEVKPVGAFCPYISYGFTNPMPSVDEGPYLLTANDIGAGEIRYQTARHTSQAAFDQLLTRKSRPIAGDVLVTKDGTLGRVAVADGAAACINQSVALLRPDEREMLPKYFSAVLRGPLYQERMTLDAGGTTIKHIYITRLSKMRLAYPSVDEQERILDFLAEKLETVDHSVVTANREIDLLNEYRTRLIADVVTGKLDVREAAAALPEVDPLAAEAEPDDGFGAGGETDLDELDVPSKEAEA